MFRILLHGFICCIPAQTGTVSPLFNVQTPFVSNTAHQIADQNEANSTSHLLLPSARTVMISEDRNGLSAAVHKQSGAAG